MRHLFKTPDNRKKSLMLVGDMFLLAVGLLAVCGLYNLLKELNAPGIFSRPLKTPMLHVAAGVSLLLLYIFEMYAIREMTGRLRLLTSLVVVGFTSFLIVFALAKVLRINRTTMVYLGVFCVLCPFVLYAWRRLFLRAFLGSEYLTKKVIFIGSDSLTQVILREMENSDYIPVGLLGDAEAGKQGEGNHLESLGALENVQALIRKKNVKTLVLALMSHPGVEVAKEIHKCKFDGLEVHRSDDFYEILTRRFAIQQYLHNGLMPFPSIDTFVSPVFKNTKRIVDFLSALVGLLVLAVPLAVIAILVKATSNGSVFYLQERLGFQEKPFRLAKFRTMLLDAEKDSGPRWASKDDTRITRLGRILRKTRLDELPQLVNLLKGEISLVGPRPIRRHFAELMEKEVPFYSLRFSIKPGLTGWAQVHYEYGGTVEGHMQKLQYDLYYIRHASLFLDLFVVLKTLQTVIRRPAY